MSDENQLTRREFTVEWALALLAGATITITGCGDDDDTSPTNPSPQPGGEVGTISANHGHNITITSGQLTAGAALNLPIMGSATHPHFIDLTAAQVMAISQNQQVSVTSTTNDAHSHVVTFN